MIDELTNTGDLDKSTKAAISELLENMQPSINQLEELAQKYRDAGQTIPNSIQEGLQNAATMGALVNDTNSVLRMIGNAVANNDGYMEITDQLEEYGYYIPEAVAQAIKDNEEIVEIAVNDLWDSTESFVNKVYRTGFKVQADVSVQLNPIYDNLTGLYSEQYRQQYTSAIPGHADGGIFSKPHLTWFAERCTEAAIPIDGSGRAIDLWYKTGELLGVEGLAKNTEGSFSSLADKVMSAPGSSQSSEITYSPTLQFYGDAPSRGDLEQALDNSQEKFKILMEQYLKDNGRVNFY